MKKFYHDAKSSSRYIAHRKYKTHNHHRKTNLKFSHYTHFQCIIITFSNHSTQFPVNIILEKILFTKINFDL